MRFIFDILKGMVMGIANVIPGVSGGTMAVSMGIYDRLIHAITHLFKEFKKSILDVLPIGIGMVAGIVGLSMVVEWMFGTIPIQTNMLFIGLILGGLPVVWKNVKSSKINMGYILGYTAFFALVVVLAVFNDAKGATADTTFNMINSLKLVGVGIVAAATMVVPGVSGSMMLMLMGYYETIISSVSGVVKALTAGNWSEMWGYCLILIPFGIGVVIGIFAIAKIIELLLTKCKTFTFWCIIGLITGSPIAIVIINRGIFAAIDLMSILTGAVALIIGFGVAMILGKE